MDCGPPGPSVHGDSLGKRTGLGWYFPLQGILSTQESNHISYLGRQILYHWDTREVLSMYRKMQKAGLMEIIPFMCSLSHLGPVSCVFLPWISSGCPAGEWLQLLMAWWWASRFHPQVPSGLTFRGGCSVMAWWLWHPLFTDMAGNIFN